jgi:hypothetical protein
MVARRLRSKLMRCGVAAAAPSCRLLAANTSDAAQVDRIMYELRRHIACDCLQQVAALLRDQLRAQPSPARPCLLDALKEKRTMSLTAHRDGCEQYTGCQSALASDNCHLGLPVDGWGDESRTACCIRLHLPVAEFSRT